MMSRATDPLGNSRPIPGGRGRSGVVEGAGRSLLQGLLQEFVRVLGRCWPTGPLGPGCGTERTCPPPGAAWRQCHLPGVAAKAVHEAQGEMREGGAPEPAPHPAAAPHPGAPGAVRPCHPHGPHPGGPAVCAPAAHRPVPLGAFPPPVPELSPPRPSAPAMPLCPRGSPQLSAAPRPSPAALTAQPPAGGPCPAHRTQGDTALRQGRGRP